jgi:predicted O-linked N-acetylglucosamine transferase (SPINDLY family)
MNGMSETIDIGSWLRRAVAHHQAGRWEAARAGYAAVLALLPAQGDSLHLIGMLHGLRDDHATAARWMRWALTAGCAAAAGNLTAALLNRGLQHRRAGEIGRDAADTGLAGMAGADKAEAALRAAVILDPAHAEIWNGLGALARGAGQPAAARRRLGHALALRSDHAEAHWNAGRAHQDAHHMTDARAHYRRALALAPGRIEIWSDFAALLSSDVLSDDDSVFRRALKVNPADTAAWNGLGGCRHRQGDLERATHAFERAVALDPGHAPACANGGILAKDIGCIGQGMVRLRHAQHLAPGNVAVHRHLLWAVLCDPTLNEEGRLAEHRRFEERHARPLYALPQPRHPNLPDPDRRLRIGYLSSDLRDHPVAHNLEPLLAARDRQAFSVTLYASTPHRDTVSDRLQGLADAWRNVQDCDDAAVAERIRTDGIDILVILAGRFDHNRPLVAAYRPAPLQVSFHDGATSGLEAMDYLIADPVMVPRGGAERFTERVIRLPSFYAHAPLDDAPEPGPPPLLRNGYPTFASFNAPAKLNDAVLSLWARLLLRVPEARLVLKYRAHFLVPALRRRVLAAFAAHGVEPARITLPEEAAQQRAAHLARYREVDIALDPFPFCGSTTSFEALWMGVPVVTLPGTNMISRWSASLLKVGGATDLIAATPEDYLAIAAGLARDPARLTGLRAGLRGRLAASSLCDGPAKARQIERLYRAIWRRWCRQIA